MKEIYIKRYPKMGFQSLCHLGDYLDTPPKWYEYIPYIGYELYRIRISKILLNYIQCKIKKSRGY